MIKQILKLSIVLLTLDLIWIKTFMKPRYENILNQILQVPFEFRIIPAIFAYIIMIFAIYYFAVKDSKTNQEALIKGSLLGLVMYGVYDGTLYAIFPINDIQTGIIDVVWGTLLCGITAYISYLCK
jgi:uncharacterized membrane protein